MTTERGDPSRNPVFPQNSCHSRLFSYKRQDTPFNSSTSSREHDNKDSDDNGDSAPTRPGYTDDHGYVALVENSRCQPRANGHDVIQNKVQHDYVEFVESRIPDNDAFNDCWLYHRSDPTFASGKEKLSDSLPGTYLIEFNSFPSETKLKLCVVRDTNEVLEEPIHRYQFEVGKEKGDKER